MKALIIQFLLGGGLLQTKRTSITKVFKKSNTFGLLNSCVLSGLLNSACRQRNKNITSHKNCREAVAEETKNKSDSGSHHL